MKKKTVMLQIEQTQQQLFQFPLEIVLQNQQQQLKQIISITKRFTGFEVPVSFTPAQLIADPEVNLIAQMHVQRNG